jgi:hypothetical protein
VVYEVHSLVTRRLTGGCLVSGSRWLGARLSLSWWVLVGPVSPKSQSPPTHLTCNKKPWPLLASVWSAIHPAALSPPRLPVVVVVVVVAAVGPLLVCRQSVRQCVSASVRHEQRCVLASFRDEKPAGIMRVPNETIKGTLTVLRQW